MAKQVKLLCDRCKKEIDTSGFWAVLKLPRRIKLESHYGNQLYKYNFDLCHKCRDKVFNILEGRENGK
jgi:hypothetical protein